MANTIVINETPRYSLSVSGDNELQLTLNGPAGPVGPTGAAGATGATGAAGPNSVTTSTSSNLTGFIAANGTNVSGATAGATAATANTLALRDATGGSNFAAVGATSVTSSGVISTTGTFAAIATTGGGANIFTQGDNANIFTSGTDAVISTSGVNGYIQSRSTFKLYDGTYTTTLSHSPTLDRAIAFPNATGTVALIDPSTGTQTFTGSQIFTGAVSTTGATASISTSGVNGSISTSGFAANIFTNGQLGFINTSGNDAQIYTSGTDAHIATQGTNAYIQSRSTFKLYNGTSTTTLSHSPTADRAIAFPNKAGTVAMVDAETHTGAHAFSSTTRPTSAGTGTPAATSLITLADSEDAKRAWISFHCTNFTGATNVKSGGTSESATLGFSSGQSSATNGNYNGYRYGTYMAMNPAGLNTTANFNRRTIFRALVISPNTASVTGEARYLWPVSTSYTTGRLTSKGIGFVFIGNKLYGHTHDGTTARITTQFVDFGANATTADCVADSNGSGTVSFYVNGTLLESLTGPTGTQTNARGVQANVQCVDSVSLFFNLLSFSLEVKI